MNAPVAEVREVLTAVPLHLASESRLPGSSSPGEESGAAAPQSKTLSRR
jgi:hypothetical protein